MRGREERKGKRNLSAACFAAIKTTEVELLSKRRQSNKEWGSLLLPSFPLVEGERSDLNMGALRVQKCTTYIVRSTFIIIFRVSSIFCSFVFCSSGSCEGQSDIN